MTKQVTFSVKEGLEKLQRSMDDLTTHAQDSVNAAVQGIAEAAYASIQAKVQASLKTTRQDYLKGLEFEKLEDGSFLISLDGKWANALEDGFPSYDMVPGLLKSTKTVEVGSRAGQPWVQNSKPRGKQKETHKFAHVPLEQQPHSAAAKTSNLADAMKNLMSQNAKGSLQSILKPFKDVNGQAIEGKVAVATPSSVQDPRLQNLVKYQKVTTDANGKQRIQSTYIVYRTISEHGKPWIHKGFSGLKAFDDAEKEVAQQITTLINSIL